jgi:prophage antirepressor-like protein
MQSVITLNNGSYYSTKDLKDQKENIAFFYGCSTSIRKIIEKKYIPENHYTFALQTKNKPFTLSSKDTKRSTLLLTIEWCERNVPSCRKRRDPSTDEKIQSTEIDKKDELQVVPQVLILNDEEKFKAATGQIIDVEVRGERHHDKIFFYGKDVERMLDMTGELKDLLTHSNGTYEDGKHYKKFIRIPTTDQNKFETQKDVTYGLVPNKTTDQTEFETHDVVSSYLSPIKPTDQKIRSCYYLTYLGLLKILLTRRHPIAEQFQRWVCEIVYTHHLGNTEQKQEQASKLIGVSVDQIKGFLSTCPVEYSEIYMCALGSVSSLKKALPDLERIDTITDSDVVIKFGYTKNLNNRLYQHQNKYEKIEGVKVSLLMHSPVDPNYLSEAESDLRKYFISEDCILDHPEHKEIIVLPDRKLKTMRVMFEQISRKYSGTVHNIQEILKAKERDYLVEFEKTVMKCDMRIREIEVKSEVRELNLQLKFEKELRETEKRQSEEMKHLMLSLLKPKEM